MNHGLIPYIGAKHRLADRLVRVCADSGADTFVDVFGGSAAVTLAASKLFGKIVYNDLDGDLVNLFRVISDNSNRVALFRMLRWTPPSRRVFEEDYEDYCANGLSFSRCTNPVVRARKTLFRHAFSFGGKVRDGGFQISLNDEYGLKEVVRYRNILRKLARVGALFRSILIENLDYQELISFYGSKANVVLYCDPPYDGTERYYSSPFVQADHVFLANSLAQAKARVVCSYYDTPLIRELYPESSWHWQRIQATKNWCLRRGNKAVTLECVITKTV